MQSLDDSHVKHAVCHTHQTILCWLHATVCCLLSVLYYRFMDDNSCVGQDGTDQSLTQVTASPLLVGTFTKFATIFCCHPLRSQAYSSFRLASMIAAKTTFWRFLPWQSREINAVMISLMWQNQLKLCALQFHWLYSNSCRGSCKAVLRIQTLPPSANTESDWCCGTEWGWFVRLGNYRVHAR